MSTVTKLNPISDKRGKLAVLLAANEYKSRLKEFGQIYMVTFEGSNIVRGNHYHQKKDEWIWLIKGSLEIYLQNMSTQKKFLHTINSKTKPVFRLEIPRNTAHAFRSITDSAILISYTTNEWDPNDDYPVNLI